MGMLLHKKTIPFHQDVMFIYICSSGVSQMLWGFANVMVSPVEFPVVWVTIWAAHPGL